MGILKNLQGAYRRVCPPCARCPYRLGLVVFVQNPCPSCMTNGYHIYDVLTRGSLFYPDIQNAGMRRNRANNRYR